jgi:hypothetical protein
LVRNPFFKIWIPAPRFRGDKLRRNDRNEIAAVASLGRNDNGGGISKIKKQKAK